MYFATYERSSRIISKALLQLKCLSPPLALFLLKNVEFNLKGADNDYAKFLGGRRGVLWDCASSESGDNSFEICLRHDH